MASIETIDTVSVATVILLASHYYLGDLLYELMRHA